MLVRRSEILTHLLPLAHARGSVGSTDYGAATVRERIAIYDELH